MIVRSSAARTRDSGAALLFAIGFVLMIGAIGGALVSVVNSSVTARSTLEAQRNREYAADGAIEQAIARVRQVTTCTPTTGSLDDSTLNAVSIHVDWQTVCGSVLSSDGSTPYPQRDVIFSACLTADAPCDNGDTIIRARVNFEPASGTVTKTFIQSWSVNR